MFAMIVGAVICDAGITAVLTSVISNKDHQAGTNSRRVQCSRRFMSSNCIDEELQERVLDFYAYADTELQNIDEVEMLRDFSLSLRSEILQHFCFDSLRSSCLLKGFSEGAIISLVNRMEPYMAIPGETISEIGRECTALYVLQRGLMNSTDETGCSVELPFGVLIGHQATKATHEKEGKLAIGVEIEILVARGLKTKYGNPYAVFRCGSKTCRSSIKKGNDWRDNILMKLPDNSDCDKLRIDVKGWRKEPLHTSLGSAEVALVDSSGQVQPVVLKDSYGKKSGVLKVRVRKYKLQEHERVNNTELTVTAQGYCHLYRMERYEINRIQQCVVRGQKESIWDRLPQCFEDEVKHRQINEKERVRQSWRRPSRPCLSLDLETTPRLSFALRTGGGGIEAGGGPDTADEDSTGGARTRALHEQPVKAQSRPSYNRRKSSGVAPIEAIIENNSSSASRSSVEDTDKIPEQGILNVKDGTTASKSTAPLISRGERDWDNLVDFSSIDRGKNSSSRRDQSRRTSFFVEWAHNSSPIDRPSISLG
uniref:Cyclic nucleotide-binding domain-containing protein n=1 Tax=Pseudictyota dubia TaxID=2749911 RepID=A0A7R9WDT9_9STRA|mmetsp:Transcript_43863/g.81572  ORF Transcript_43863/g.81572 Transcript_43863/m.81572 type:complete len:538 (+) Transcript_43863:459-2072(+)